MATNSHQEIVRRILNARVYDVAIESALTLAPELSRRIEAQVHLKREDQQSIFSFKCRGAFNKLTTLDASERTKGVVAASAGNHAQGVALAAQRLGVQAKIVMPVTTPAIKVQAVKSLGAIVVLFGDSFDEAAEHARKIELEDRSIYLHPFDDLDVISGQGTVAMELMRQAPAQPDIVFIPCGGGGLLAGMAAYIKYVSPATRVIGVEPEDAACTLLALKKNRPAKLPEVGLFADGCAVAQVGRETFKLIRRHVDEIVTATTDEMCAAVKDIFQDTRVIAEPAGALGVAGIKKYASNNLVKDLNISAVLTGANTNFERLGYVCERTNIGERREAILSVKIPERPGAFKSFCRAIGRRNITEFNYRYTDPTKAQVFLGLNISPDGHDLQTMLQSLQEKKYDVENFTDNDLATTHIRHMVGGCPHVSLKNERVFRVEFPERPGALLKFLDALGSNFSITLFHYRNHGAAYGRILVGFTPDGSEGDSLGKRLRAIGYRHWEETGNPAYRDYLRHPF